jgi:MoxR-like ATPase
MIVKSRKFYPTYITGLSGNGKTMMIEQICAQEGRELVRANITKETDEDDLIGGFRLSDGKTVWQNGPVIVAMERGAILLLDEVDLGDAKLMCLQPILEGKPVYLKKINRVIAPAPGFNILATANTKGKGSDDGRFIGTNVMNEAFLERFSITFEQEYPSTKTEAKILNNVLKTSGIEDKDFVDKLVNWADMIRKAFYDGAVSDIISTRRLVHICEAFSIFGQDREKAIKLCLNRFDVDTKNGFFDLYAKLDEKVLPKTEVKEEVKTKSDDEIAF